jgi:tetratricopeptide (TPR) repeat protein
LPEAVMAQLYHERAKMVAPDRTRSGLSQQQQEDERKAGEWLVKAITKAPSDLRTRLYAAQWALDISPWYGAKKLDEAVKQAQSALKIDPDSIAARLLLAQISLIKRDYPGAEKLLLEAHAVAPSNGAVAGTLAVALAEQSDAAKRRLALEYAQLAARSMGDHPEASIPLAWALYRSGRLDEAQQVIAPVVNSGNRPSPDTVYLLSKLLADRGRKSEARQFLERGIADVSIGNVFLMREAAAEFLKELGPATSPK